MSPDQEAHAPPVQTPTVIAEKMVTRLAEALAAEFTFLGAEPEQWETAATGIWLKMGVHVTSGEDEVVIVTIP